MAVVVYLSKSVREVGNHGTIGTINSSFACDIMDPLQKAYLKVAYDGMSAADAMAWAEEEANKILQEVGE